MPLRATIHPSPALMSALITSQVGIISFIGLAAPALVRLAGVRRFTHQLIFTPLAGAGLLTLVDQLAQFLSPAGGDLPTGMASMRMGSP